MAERGRRGLILPKKYSIQMRPLKERKCVPIRKTDSHSNANSRESVNSDGAVPGREETYLRTTQGDPKPCVLFQPEIT